MGMGPGLLDRSGLAVTTSANRVPGKSEDLPLTPVAIARIESNATPALPACVGPCRRIALRHACAWRDVGVAVLGYERVEVTFVPPRWLSPGCGQVAGPGEVATNPA